MNRPVPDHQADFDERLVKVFVRLEPADWHDYETESVWAEPLNGGGYRVRSVPFYAMGISHDDVVRASLVDDRLFLEGVQCRGGHSTYRFITMHGITEDQWLPYWHALEDIGCTYERGSSRLFAVDIPPDVDIYKAYALLDAGEKAGVWGFQEAHCGHPLRG